MFCKTGMMLCFGVQKQYPERLGQLFIYEAPTVFWALWNMIWPFLNASTRDKVQLVSGDAGRASIHSMVPSNILPSALGGTSPLKPFADAGRSLAAGDGVQHTVDQKVQTSKQSCTKLAAGHARHASIADSVHSDATDL